MKNRPKRILSLISAISIFILCIFTGTVKTQAANNGQTIVDYARRFLGKPYVYGCAGPNSFDCSGLTYYVYSNVVGTNIGRTTYDQINSGMEVSRNELQPGDLVFTHAGHVGIYVGDNKMIHAPQTGDVVKISNITRFWRAKRILRSSSQSVDLHSEKIRTLCNTSFYSSKYNDLARVYGNNSTGLYNHYITYGISEGRMAAQTFDVSYYLNKEQTAHAATRDFWVDNSEDIIFVKDDIVINEVELKDIDGYMQALTEAENHCFHYLLIHEQYSIPTISITSRITGSGSSRQ